MDFAGPEDGSALVERLCEAGMRQMLFPQRNTDDKTPGAWCRGNMAICIWLQFEPSLGTIQIGSMGQTLRECVTVFYYSIDELSSPGMLSVAFISSPAALHA